MTRAQREKPGRRLKVAVTDARGRRIRRGPGARLGSWLSGAAPPSTRGRVDVALVTDDRMKNLNRKFRGKNRVTDVLSFPPSEPDHVRARGAVSEKFLGDLAIALGAAARQARQLGHPVAVELRILALHGLLHLLGYDHETDRGEMGRLEDHLRRRAGLPSGLIAR